MKEKLEKSQLFRVKTVDVEGSQVSIYELIQVGRLSLLLAVLGCAAEYAGHAGWYTGYFGCEVEQLLG